MDTSARTYLIDLCIEISITLHFCSSHRDIIQPQPRPEPSTPTLHTQPQHTLLLSHHLRRNPNSLLRITRPRLEPKYTLAIPIDRHIAVPIHRLLAPDSHIVRLARHHGNGLRHLHEPVVVRRFSLGLEAVIAVVRAGSGLAGHCAGCEREAVEGPGGVAGAFEVAVDDDLGRDRGRGRSWCCAWRGR